MKQITIDKKVYVLDYTFNSIRYMDDLNFNELQNIEETPFKFYTFNREDLMVGICVLTPNKRLRDEIQSGSHPP